MPEPPRPGCRSSAGQPNNPAAHPRSSRSRRNYRRAPAGDTAQGWPVPPARFGIRWTPAPRAFGKVVGDVGNRRHERPGDPHDPLPDRMGVPQGVSKRGRDQSRTDGPVYSVRESRDHHLGTFLPRAVRDARPAPHLARHRGVFDIEVDTTVQQAIRSTDHELRFSLASLRPAPAVPGNRDGRGGDCPGRRTRLPSPRTRSRRTTRPDGISMRHSSRSRRKGGVCVLSAGRSWRSDGSVVS